MVTRPVSAVILNPTRRFASPNRPRSAASFVAGSMIPRLTWAMSWYSTGATWRSKFDNRRFSFVLRHAPRYNGSHNISHQECTFRGLCHASNTTPSTRSPRCPRRSYYAGRFELHPHAGTKQRGVGGKYQRQWHDSASAGLIDHNLHRRNAGRSRPDHAVPHSSYSLSSSGSSRHRCVRPEEPACGYRFP